MTLSILETRHNKIKYLVWALFFSAAYSVPFVIHDAYYIDILTKATMYLTLAVSLSLIIGQLGMLSLAHPAFFGIGAYASALLSLKLGVPVLISMLLAGVIAYLIALLIAFPLMKLTYHSFAIGTLAVLMISNLLALNWIKLTRGPMCIPGTPVPKITIPGLFNFSFETERAFYYLILVIATIT